MRLAALVTVFICFTVWSLIIVIPEGLPGLLASLRTPWGQQVFVDLVIALLISWAWLVPEARSRGINPWPYFVATLFSGCIAVLAFLVHRELVLRRGVGAGPSSNTGDSMTPR